MVMGRDEKVKAEVTKPTQVYPMENEAAKIEDLIKYLESLKKPSETKLDKGLGFSKLNL